MPGSFQSCQSEECPRWYSKAGCSMNWKKQIKAGVFSELFQVVLCFILMGMTTCCNPLSSRQNQFVIVPWIYQIIALGKYLSL